MCKHTLYDVCTDKKYYKTKDLNEKPAFFKINF